MEEVRDWVDGYVARWTKHQHVRSDVFSFIFNLYCAERSSQTLDGSSLRLLTSMTQLNPLFLLKK